MGRSQWRRCIFALLLVILLVLPDASARKKKTTSTFTPGFVDCLICKSLGEIVAADDHPCKKQSTPKSCKRVFEFLSTAENHETVSRALAMSGLEADAICGQFSSELEARELEDGLFYCGLFVAQEKNRVQRNGVCGLPPPPHTAFDLAGAHSVWMRCLEMERLLAAKKNGDAWNEAADSLDSTLWTFEESEAFCDSSAIRRLAGMAPAPAGSCKRFFKNPQAAVTTRRRVLLQKIAASGVDDPEVSEELRSVGTEVEAVRALVTVLLQVVEGVITRVAGSLNTVEIDSNSVSKALANAADSLSSDLQFAFDTYEQLVSDHLKPLAPVQQRLEEVASVPSIRTKNPDFKLSPEVLQFFLLKKAHSLGEHQLSDAVGTALKSFMHEFQSAMDQIVTRAGELSLPQEEQDDLQRLICGDLQIIPSPDYQGEPKVAILVNLVRELISLIDQPFDENKPEIELIVHRFNTVLDGLRLQLTSAREHVEQRHTRAKEIYTELHSIGASFSGSLNADSLVSVFEVSNSPPQVQLAHDFERSLELFERAFSKLETIFPLSPAETGSQDYLVRLGQVLHFLRNDLLARFNSLQRVLPKFHATGSSFYSRKKEAWSVLRKDGLEEIVQKWEDAKMNLKAECLLTKMLRSFVRTRGSELETALRNAAAPLAKGVSALAKFVEQSESLVIRLLDLADKELESVVKPIIQMQ